MTDVQTKQWNFGIFNLQDAEKIPHGSASDALNWISYEDKVELARGKTIYGALSTSSEPVRGLHVAFKVNGDSVFFRKIGTKIQYSDTGGAWTDVITGLTNSAEYTFANYSSLAGNAVYVGGTDGLYKIMVANPGSYSSLYVDGKNYKGKIMISDARMFCWDISKDKTGLYLSYIDENTYTTITAEAIGGSGITRTGTLAFKAGGATRTAFGVTFTDTVETFTDNYNGVLTGSAGGTGTINYTSGAYSITFAVNPTNPVTSTYQWEDSNNHGVSDFTYGSPRQAGQGADFRQDVGGYKIMNVVVYDGVYYSFKDRSVYQLTLTDDDTNATNLVFRSDIGLPNFRAVIPTGMGMIFMNTANPDQPKLTILQKNLTGDTIIPTELATQFNFANYNWDECCMETYGEYIIFSGRTLANTVNDTMFLYNTRLKTIDVCGIYAHTMMKDKGYFYTGDSVSSNTYKTLYGFDDDGALITNYWISNFEDYGSEELKTFKRLIVRGYIAFGQQISFYMQTDNSNAWTLIGAIDGSSSTIDNSTTNLVGQNMVGEVDIGGDYSGTTPVGFYFAEYRVQADRFRGRKLKFEATGTGYASVIFELDKDIRMSGWGNRIPIKYRQVI